MPTKKTQSNKTNSKPSALHRLYKRQQSKVNFSSRQANLLTTFAEEDHKRIAQLITRWISEDSKKQRR